MASGTTLAGIGDDTVCVSGSFCDDVVVVVDATVDGCSCITDHVATVVVDGIEVVPTVATSVGPDLEAIECVNMTKRFIGILCHSAVIPTESGAHKVAEP